MTVGMSGRILAVACAMTKADENERETLALLCTAEEKALEGRLREGVCKEECEDAFICAAAFLAAAALESARAGGEELSSLRAGDLTVTKRLAALREQAQMLMRPYTKDGAFCFFGVQG